MTQPEVGLGGRLEGTFEARLRLESQYLLSDEGVGLPAGAGRHSSSGSMNSPRGRGIGLALGLPRRRNVAQPERDMAGLHRLLDDHQQVAGQRVQVYFVADLGT